MQARYGHTMTARYKTSKCLHAIATMHHSFRNRKAVRS